MWVPQSSHHDQWMLQRGTSILTIDEWSSCWPALLPWALGRRFCLKSICPPIVMEEDMLWFGTNYQVLPYPTYPSRFNSRFTKCHSAIVPCGSFLHCIRCDASHKTVKWRKPRRLKWTCHAMAPQTSEEHISKTLGLHCLKVEIRWVGGTPKDILTFQRRKPPEWVDSHHKDSHRSKIGDKGLTISHVPNVVSIKKVRVLRFLCVGLSSMES